MKTLKQYIIEGSDKDTDKDNKGKLTSEVSQADIKFTIWEEPDKKVTELKDNETYQKIEYKLEDKTDHISVDFLLGYQNDSWKIWIGKIGSCSYDDDPYFSFDTDNFKLAVVKSLDTIAEFIQKIKDDPEDYVQFYTNM